MSLPDQAAVTTQLAAFETELAQARTLRDAQSVRDRYLGRKNSVVASWMQLIAAASTEDKRAIGRWANELKRAVESRWTDYEATAQQAAPDVEPVDVTLPGRGTSLGRRHPLTLVRDRMEDIFARMEIGRAHV